MKGENRIKGREISPICILSVRLLGNNQEKCLEGDRSWSLGNVRPSLVAQTIKNPPACGRPGFDPWVGKIPFRRERLPTPGSWHGELHGLDSLWGLKESDTTERLSLTQGTVKSRCKENLELPLFAGVKEIV